MQCIRKVNQLIQFNNSGLSAKATSLLWTCIFCARKNDKTRLRAEISIVKNEKVLGEEDYSLQIYH